MYLPKQVTINILYTKLTKRYTQTNIPKFRLSSKHYRITHNQSRREHVYHADIELSFRPHFTIYPQTYVLARNYVPFFEGRRTKTKQSFRVNHIITSSYLLLPLGQHDLQSQMFFFFYSFYVQCQLNNNNK